LVSGPETNIMKLPNDGMNLHIFLSMSN
jgi:hypothetical protein